LLHQPSRLQILPGWSSSTSGPCVFSYTRVATQGSCPGPAADFQGAHRAAAPTSVTRTAPRSLCCGAVVFASHRRQNAVPFDDIAKLLAGVLAAQIGVKDQPSLWTAPQGIRFTRATSVSGRGHYVTMLPIAFNKSLPLALRLAFLKASHCGYLPHCALHLLVVSYKLVADSGLVQALRESYLSHLPRYPPPMLLCASNSLIHQ
jgi:hypothetical protein